MKCGNCGSDDTEVYESEFEDEPTTLKCWDCGDEELLY